MQYMLMFYQPVAEFEQRAETQALYASWMDYVGAIRASGAVPSAPTAAARSASSANTRPPTITQILGLRDGKPAVIAVE